MTLLLHAAHDTLGQDGLNALLRPPFAVTVGDRPRIQVHAGTTSDVWCGSVWTAVDGERDEAGKVLGVQPGCEWAAPTLRAFFAAVQERHTAAVRERSA